jgi:hypothetical protein
VRRLLWESSLGVGETKGQLGPVYNWLLVPLFLRHVFADKERQEQMLRSSSLDWTIVQSAALTNGPRTGGLSRWVQGLRWAAHSPNLARRCRALHA